MGVPAFFRWLSMRYPKIVVACVEQLQIAVDGTEIPIDATEKNPNGVEFDNLYLDMNGIIHPCTHPEDRPAPTTEIEMFEEVQRYVDRILRIVRPRKVLYLAIDGVAPRAKINQQRSRRFRAAKDAQLKASIEKKLASEWKEKGFSNEDEDDDDDNDQDDDDNQGVFDSNVITPGTPFMDRLAIWLRQYVSDRVANDAAWKELKVVFSDASVPGEGEHKIADFIRRQRLEKGYNPNTKHVLYGLDADLIMLGLATHEASFTILREEVQDRRGPPSLVTRTGVDGENGKKKKKEPDEDGTLRGTVEELGGKKPFQFVHIHVLREYLEYEFRDHMEQIHKQLGDVGDRTFVFDLERVVDDFVFMCFFVGNDFLPHLPSLEIREGGIDFLLELYKKLVPRFGYITDGNGEPDFNKSRVILAEVAQREDEVFRARMISEQRHAAQRLRENPNSTKRSSSLSSSPTPNGSSKAPSPPPSFGKEDSAAEQIAGCDGRGSAGGGAVGSAYELKQLIDKAEPEMVELGRSKDALATATERKRAREAEVSAGVKAGEDMEPDQNESKKRRGSAEERKKMFKEELDGRVREKNEIADVKDNIKLGESGWKVRYYENKMHWKMTDGSFGGNKSEFCAKYFEGLLWVMRYYYRGCESWTWFYPYHYAPFASDLVECGIDAKSIVFEKGVIFTPLEQLMSVLPAASARGVLPDTFVELMREKSGSPIEDFYPEDFELDLNGKRFAWQGIALLPFVDEKRLRDALSPLYQTLSDEERERNETGNDFLFVNKHTPLGQLITSTLSTPSNSNDNSAVDGDDGGAESGERKKTGRVEIPVEMSGGVLFGAVLRFEAPRAADLDYVGRVGVAEYVMKEDGEGRHVCRMLEGVTDSPKKVLEIADKYEVQSGMLGWKTAKFGPLGVAAKRMAQMRGATAVDAARRAGGIGIGGGPGGAGHGPGPGGKAANGMSFQRAAPPQRPQYSVNARASNPNTSPMQMGAPGAAQPRWIAQQQQQTQQLGGTHAAAFPGTAGAAQQVQARYSVYYQAASSVGVAPPRVDHNAKTRALSGPATESMRRTIFAKRNASQQSIPSAAPPAATPNARGPFGNANANLLFSQAPPHNPANPSTSAANPTQTQHHRSFGFGPPSNQTGHYGSRR